MNNNILQEQMAQIKEYLTRKSWPCLILVGRAGTGKTTALLHVARELNYKVWSIDLLTDDLDKVIWKMKFKPFTTIIIHIASADAVNINILSRIINEAKKHGNLLVLESTRPLGLECHEVEFYRPKAREIVKLIEQLNIPFDKVKMHSDLRQVVLSKYGTMGYDEEKTITKIVEQYLKTGRLEEVNDTALSLLLDSAHLNFYGKDLYFFIKTLQVADKCKRPEPLSEFKVVKPVVVSYFLEKLKLSKTVKE